MELDKRELVRKRDQYRKYIGTHIENVRKAWYNMKRSTGCLATIEMYRGQFTSLDTVLNKNINIEADARPTINVIDDLITKHDMSKYTKEEFEPYRKHFYPINDEEKENSEVEFEEAWKHHYENNLHHWNWWSKIGQKNNMPMNYVIEMCCDWIAMSMVFSDSNAYEWYQNNKLKIDLGSRQRALAEDLLQKYYMEFKTNGKPVYLD